MRSGERVEVDWGDVLKELALVEDADEVPTDEPTKAVPGNGEFCHDAPALFEFFHFLEDLKREYCGVERTSRTWDRRAWG